MGCGCAQRQAALNKVRPGLGDKVKSAIDYVLGVVTNAVSGK